MQQIKVKEENLKTKKIKFVKNRTPNCQTLNTLISYWKSHSYLAIFTARS